MPERVKKYASFCFSGHYSYTLNAQKPQSEYFQVIDYAMPL